MLFARIAFFMVAGEVFGQSDLTKMAPTKKRFGLGRAFLLFFKDKLRKYLFYEQFWQIQL